MSLKRLIDIIGSIFLILLLAPFMAIIAILIYASIGVPVIFRQERPGLHGKPFMLYKFRTMTNAKDSKGNVLPDAARITPLGQFLRTTSIDELPELINVLRGDMSLVGPRPLLMQYLDLYTPEQARRHEVLPGVTGWAQINGRNLISWEKKFELDLWYVDHRSLSLDLRIIVLTVWKVVKREAISQDGQATVENFKGSSVRSIGDEHEL